MKKHAGRIGYYRPEYKEQAYKLALLGATIKEMSAFFGVDTSIFEYWLRHNEEFRLRVDQGRVEADSRVAFALYRRAVGFAYTEKFTARNKHGEVTRVEETEKLIPPDVTACLRWLALRRKHDWADTTKIDIRHQAILDVRTMQGQLSSPDISTEELKLALKLALVEAQTAMTNNHQEN